jgi:hypothetical protein
LGSLIRIFIRVYNYVMNPRLHALLLELDNKFDIEIYDYFKLTEQDKAELTKILVEYYLPEMDRNPLFVVELKRAFRIKLIESESEQEYERCDICIRVIELLNEWTFSE